ncbi:MAG: hypothetical protein ACTSVY_07420 [Candidatus Helarchaeota archaeon]
MEKRKTVGFKTIKEKKNLLYGIIMIMLIGGVFAAYLFTGGFGFGSIFGGNQEKPSPPPEQFQTGYAIILMYDNTDGSLIDNSSVSIDFFEYWNDTTLGKGQAGVMYEINETTLAFISVEGYWNVSASVYARNDSSDPYINKFYMNPKCNRDNVTLSFIYINSSYGSFGADNISSGINELKLRVKLDGSLQGNHSYAGLYYVPQPLRIGNQSHYNVSRAGTWLGFEGNITSCKIYNVEVEIVTVGNISVVPFHTTYVDQVYDLEINATTSITKIYLFANQIDDFSKGMYINGTGGLIKP